MKDKNKCIKWILEGGVDDGDCRCPKCKEESMNRTTKRRIKMTDLNRIIEFLGTCDGASNLYDMWDKLPVGSHLRKVLPRDKNNIGQRVYQVYNLKFPEILRADYVLSIIKKMKS